MSDKLTIDILDKDTSIDELIRRLTYEKEQLTDRDLKRYERLEFVHDLLKNGMSRRDCRELIISKYAVGQTAAYAYIKDAQHLFGALDGVNKEWVRSVVLDKCMSALTKAEKTDLKLVAPLAKVIIELAGLNEEADQQALFEQMRQHNYFLIINAQGEKVPVDLSQLMQLADGTNKETILKSLDHAQREEQERELFGDS